MKRNLIAVMLIFLSLASFAQSGFIELGNNYTDALKKANTLYPNEIKETKLLVADHWIPAIIVTTPKDWIVSIMFVFGTDNKCQVIDYCYNFSFLQTEISLLNSQYTLSSTENNTWTDGKKYYRLQIKKDWFDLVVTPS